MSAQIRESLRAELEANRAAFHALLAALTEADLARPSANPPFSVREVLHHMVQSLQVVPWEARAAQRGRNLLAMPQWLYDAGFAVWSARLTAWFQTRAS